MIYEIWSEGYRATGNESGANFHGLQEANSFQEACDKFFGTDKYYDKKLLKYWSCRLYDNEENARKLWG